MDNQNSVSVARADDCRVPKTCIAPDRPAGIFLNRRNVPYKADMGIECKAREDPEMRDPVWLIMRNLYDVGITNVTHYLPRTGGYVMEAPGQLLLSSVPVQVLLQATQDSGVNHVYRLHDRTEGQLCGPCTIDQKRALIQSTSTS